jgi:hypothetical protein
MLLLDRHNGTHKWKPDDGSQLVELLWGCLVAVEQTDRLRRPPLNG